MSNDNDLTVSTIFEPSPEMKILEILEDPVIITDLSNKILWLSNKVEKVFPAVQKRAIGEDLFTVLDPLITESRERWSKAAKNIREKGAVQKFYIEFGRYSFEIFGSPVKVKDNYEVIVWRCKEKREELREERDPAHLGSFIRTIQRIGRLIVNEKTGSSLIQNVCEGLSESEEFSGSWAVLLDNQKKPLESAEFGIGEGFQSLMNLLATEKLPPCIDRLFDIQEEPFTINHELCFSHGCPVAKRRDPFNAIVTRLQHDGKFLGILAYYRTCFPCFNREEITLFKHLAADIAFVLHTISLDQERKISEEALQKSENRFRLLAEHSFFGLAIMNPDRTFEYLNPRFTEITGYTLADVPNTKTWLNLAYPDDNYRAKMLISWREGWGGKIEPGKTNEGIYRIRCKSGEHRTLHFKSVVADDGKIISSCEDITEKQNLELQLQQSQKMEAIGKLAGGIAHDFNNLLTTILGMSDLILMDLDEGDDRRLEIKEIKKAAKRASSLTKQLLAFSRRQILQPVVLNLNTIVLEMNKLLRRLIGEDIELVTVLGEKLGNVRVDQSQIEQVIMNLAVNARDAMPKGGKLTIETCNVELDVAYSKSHVGVKPGSYVLLAITDTGSGMDRETMARIFDPFFTTKVKNGGTGLGLSVVYGIVKQSGGIIWVYSEPGKGTTFKIYLPRVYEEVQKWKLDDISSDSLAGTETVLVVEDDDMVRRLTKQILSSAGYKVFDARYGEEALHISREYKGNIDLIVTDVVMPQMSGKELVRRLKAFRPEMKVLYMSGYTDNAIVNHGILEPDVAFVQKPFSLTGILKKVREVLG